jgi:hypothetical protein
MIPSIAAGVTSRFRGRHSVILAGKVMQIEKSVKRGARYIFRGRNKDAKQCA